MMSAIVDHLWQSTLCVVVAWLLTLVLRNNAARVRFWVWFAASIKFLIPFSLLTSLGSQFAWRVDASTQVGGTLIAGMRQMAGSFATPDLVLRTSQAQSFDFIPVLLAIWIGGGLLLLARWGMNWWRVSSAARKGQPLAMQAPIAIRSTVMMSEPGVVGVVSPVLLLPEGIASRLTATQLQAVLAHELCHVRRRDNLTAALHMFVEVVFWFHPLVWWIGAKLVAERERACDEDVVELGNEPQAYAESILKVCQFYMESKLTCVAGVSGADLKQRVEAIMSKRKTIELNAVKRGGLLAAAVLVIASPVASGLMTGESILGPSTASTMPSIDNLSLQIFASRSARPAKFRDGMELFQPRQSVRAMIGPAYQLQSQQIVGGPAWIDTVFYDKYLGGSGLAPDGLLRVNQFAMLERRLLADRFKLKFHREVQWAPVYVLAVANHGRTDTLLEVSPVDTGEPIMLSVKDKPEDFPRQAMNAPMHHVAYMLSLALDAIVIDRTGLAGRYRIELPTDPTPATLPAMLEKHFGLKLTRSTEQMEMFVIDSIEQPRVGP